MTTSRSRPGHVSGNHEARIRELEARVGGAVDGAGNIIATVIGPPNDHAARHAEGAADELDVATLGSDGANAGDVPLADGAGGIDWGPPPAGAAGNVGTALVDFGAFPGASDASVDVTGQTTILSGSVVEAWLRPVDTADHTADEHVVESLRVIAGNIVAGVGFTIYAVHDNPLREPDMRRDPPGRWGFSSAAGVLWTSSLPGRPIDRGGKATRLYGQWAVQWRWS